MGRAVHYVSHGTPVRADGSQAFSSQCRAAIVTEVEPEIRGGRTTIDVERIGLCVLNPTGLFFHSIADGGSVHREETKAGGSWHWPERVE